MSLDKKTLKALQEDEQLIAGDNNSNGSAAGMEAFVEFALNYSDELGACSEFVKDLVHRRLPWVAVKTTCECGSNAFYNSRVNCSNVASSMVWQCIWGIVAELDEFKFYEQSANLLKYATTYWVTTDIQKLDFGLRTAAAFKAAGDFKKTSDEIAEAANFATKLGQNSRAYLLYWEAANMLRRDSMADSLAAIKLLRNARSIANSQAEYRDAGRILLAEKD